MDLHLHASKYKIESNMDKINDEAIQCQESVNVNQFKHHANIMMRHAYQLDSNLHIGKQASTYHIAKELKGHIKQLQHPIVNQQVVSKDTLNQIKYIYQCLSKLTEHLHMN